MSATLELRYHDQEYIVRENSMPDMVLYDVFRGHQRVFTMGLNEEAEWESDADVDQTLVQALGDQIESINE